MCLEMESKLPIMLLRTVECNNEWVIDLINSSGLRPTRRSRIVFFGVCMWGKSILSICLFVCFST